ncbi:GTP binding Elongation factor Tu family protein [Salix suchowensis]|nr:GTP binding Elongation factor Tu family protein [Salix suchowensis]KAG5222535.1 GTP binding Elongation factor Tu family protein [Salix suchowensis]
MVAKEMSLRPLQDDSELQDFDDEAETLSLCDLPLYSCASDWDDLSKEDQNLGTSFDQDFFEFFSGDFTASTCPSDNIIFCGKLIPYKGETVEEKAESLAGSTTKEKNSKKSFGFHWKPSSFNKSRTAPPKQLQQKSERTLQVPLSENHGWYFSAFGVGRFPAEMELRDIKTRQNKKSPSKMFQSEEGIEMSSKKRGKGLWSLLRVLGHSSHHSSTALAN